MHKFIGIFFAVIILAGCAKGPPETVEEKVLTRSMAMLQSGKAFNEVCNKVEPKGAYDFSKKENVMIMGNEQMLAARLGGLMKIRHKDMSIDESVEKLIKNTEKWRGRAKKMLEEKGCDSEEAGKMKAAYKVYTSLNMILLMQMVDAQIVKEGGTVTPLEKLEEWGSTSKK